MTIRGFNGQNTQLFSVYVRRGQYRTFFGFGRDASKQATPATTTSSGQPPTVTASSDPKSNTLILQVSRPLPVTKSLTFFDYLIPILWLALGFAFLWSFFSSAGFPVSVKPKSGHNTNVTFNDVIGVDEAKHELQAVVEFLKDPAQFKRLGAKLPRGILLVGPPGTGKTLLAKAVAGEAGVPFFFASGSEFEEIFVGVGPKRIRTLFEEARKNAPSIIFIDELDSVAAKRKTLANANQALASSLNQLLTEMDGFVEHSEVIVLAATNLPDVLDPAVTRPGRFDKRVEVPSPDVRGRKQLLDYYLSKVVSSPDVDTELVARGTPGFTGADISNLVNIAALKATLRGLQAVNMACIDEAKDDVMLGLQRKSLMSDEERRITAYHESGHALVALFTEGAYPVYKATILPRGSSLGVTHMLPEKDEYLHTKTGLLAQMAVSMGGRAAEEIIFGPAKITGGAASDFQHATRLARAMVSQMGMNEHVGPLFVDPQEAKWSSATLNLLESEIRALLQERYNAAKTVLLNHKTELHRLAAALLEYETLSRDEILQVIKGEKPKSFTFT
jgi:ATP-dependent metalloprotease